jgi:uncharacterized protein (DUF1684 family)
MLRSSFTLVFSISLTSAFAQASPSYKAEIEVWHEKRIKDLKAENGWLNLAGLFWLNEGRNSFGAAKSNDLIFPAGKIAEQAGYFERKGNEVKLVVTGDNDVLVAGQPVKESVIFPPAQAKPIVVSRGPLRWTIIQRENKLGVRLRDLKSTQLDSFTGIHRFPVDSNWRAVARLETNAIPKTIPITNVLGQTTQQTSPGKLVFTLRGKTWSLDALEEGDELFIIFGDATNGEETYPSGRFLYAKKPGPDGLTVVDFNKAYNPPCAFTAFATCPLPPRQNQLPIPVSAGEMNYGH